MSFFSTFNSQLLHLNSHKSYLMGKSLEKKQATLGPSGELVIQTGTHTGRSPDDKFVVMNSVSEKSIWWENNLKSISQDQFHALRKDVEEYLSSQGELFATERSIGNSEHYALNIEFVSEMPSAAFFTQYMFKNRQPKAHETYGILHAPHMKIDPKKYGLRSGTAIVTCFKEKLTIIIGTLYAGEIKKSMFSIMNFILPTKGILPMHSGANLNSKGQSFVFFGLSGTGKTTLSTDVGTFLIGDDEHGLSEKGLFNFEGGCYAKTFKLAADTEPGIHKASTQFSSFLENVSANYEKGTIDFFDSSFTENGRASYPLEFIEDREPSGQGPLPQHMFFLSADAFGVLPPVAKLTRQQAMDFFILGYTAKLAGTEIGVKSPKATFSTCFGAPFMLRHPQDYASLLSKYLEKYNINVWMVNTGWTGGPYGVGERFPIKTTREIIRAIQNHELDDVKMDKDPIFGLQVPAKVRDISVDVLNPEKAWASATEYKQAAQALAQQFQEQLKKLKTSSGETSPKEPASAI
ncbi:phosphoenolpyruvate carboxykinase [Bdellovibrio sp. HCB2-146]|uniref:phosphoenolpyruvate carboxykinase n=1 Tax=Bdellovibrio sp. HCB2-146 TaxID=3394362 RepID=UPI0039BD151D